MGQEDPLEESMATHSSILAWRIPRAEFAMGIGFPGGSAGKNLPASVGDSGLIPGLGRSPGGEHGNPFQYSCLGNPMDRRAWQATYSPWGCQTQLSNR